MLFEGLGHKNETWGQGWRMLSAIRTAIRLQAVLAPHLLEINAVINHKAPQTYTDALITFNLLFYFPWVNLFPFGKFLAQKRSLRRPLTCVSCEHEAVDLINEFNRFFISSKFKKVEKWILFCELLQETIVDTADVQIV